MQRNAILQEEAEDFDIVAREFRPRIFRFALASLRDRDAAETLTQDCLLKAYLARERFRGECSMQTWLMQIAVNLVRDRSRNRRLRFWRRLQRNAQTADPGTWLADAARNPEALTSMRQQVQAVWKSARQLPERQRTVFLLRFVEDMDLLEIAAVTGMKEGTVKTHLFRAVTAVRKRLEARP